MEVAATARRGSWGGEEEGLEDGGVGRDMAEGGPGGEFLEFEGGFDGGVKGGGEVGSRVEGSEGGGAGGGEVGDEGTEEVGGELLLGVTIGGGKLVEHQCQLVGAGGVVGGDGAGALVEEVDGPVRPSVIREGSTVRFRVGGGVLMIHVGEEEGIATLWVRVRVEVCGVDDGDLKIGEPMISRNYS